MHSRSPGTLPADTGATLFSTGHGFAGQSRFLDAQILRFEQAQVGRHAVALGQQHDVARHQLRRVDGLAQAVAQHAGTWA